MADRTGQLLGNYRLVRLLGQGGFAEVYLGEHIHLESEAAIKLLHTQLTGEDRDAFRKEARILARLIHPHIVRVFDFGIEGETPFLVMDYAPNGMVRKQQPKGVALPLPTILDYVKQVADALQYAHNEHFIHRDVKPENLLVGRYQELLLSDFGIALLTQTSRSQSMQDVTGTASYMAPEQFRGKPRPASDQYALAIMVYEWLTGACPFHGSFTEIASQHLFVPPPPLREKVPGLSPMVEQVVMIALAKDPKERFATVQAFATALEQASQTSFDGAAPASAAPQAADTMSVPSQAQQAPELAPALSESLIPIELVTPVSKSAIPTELAAPPSQVPVSTDVISETALTEAATPSPPPPQVTLVSQPIGTTLYTYRGHSKAVRSSEAVGSIALAWSPDGTRIASGDWDNIQVWGAADGGGHAFIPRGGIWVRLVVWSPDGRRIALLTADKYLEVWDAAGGGNVFDIPYDYWGWAWSPDGTRIASGGWDNIQVLDAATGNTLLTYRGHSYEVKAVAWSPDGTHLASGGGDSQIKTGDHTVQVWDATTGNNVLTYRGHSSYVKAVAWSPDGRRLASASNDKTVQVWDVADGGNIFTYRGHSDAVNAVVWSPDGRRLAARGWDNTVEVWDATTGQNVFTYRRHSDTEFAGWSPDLRHFALSGRDNTVQVWDATTDRNIYTYRGHSDAVRAVVWSPDGSRIASASVDKTVQVWQALSPALADARVALPASQLPASALPPTVYVPASPSASTLPSTQRASVPPPLGTLLCTYRGHADKVRAVAWSPDSRRIASASVDKTVQVWDASTGKLLLSYRGHSHEANAVAWSPDGTRLASASNDKTVQVWDVADGGNVYSRGSKGLFGGHGFVNGVAWSPDGKRIVSGQTNKTVQAWDASTGKNLLTYEIPSSEAFGQPEPSAVAAVAWSPDGTRIATSELSGLVRVWNASTGKLLLSYRGHSDFTRSVDWSPDSTRIASGSDDKTVQVWNASTGKLLLSYRGHSGKVCSVAWSPDGRRIASGSNDKTSQVWAAITGETLSIYQGHSSTVRTVAWSPDGTRIASGSYDQTVQIWQVL